MKIKKNIIFIILLIPWLFSCNNYDINIDSRSIKEVLIVSNGFQPDTIHILEKNNIFKITKCLNKSRKELIKFLPKYRLRLIRNRDTLNYSIQGNAIIDEKGFIYRSKYDIEETIINIVK